MKKFLLLLIFSAGIFISAQEEIKKDSVVTDTIKHWSVLGKQSLMINQAAFSELTTILPMKRIKTCGRTLFF
jgi:hypothetical protein